MRVDWSFTQTFHHDPYPAIDPTRPELSAKGKVVIIVGASRGIGLATAASFAKAGAADVIITGRSQQSLENAKRSIEEAGKSRVHAFVADIADHAAIEAVFLTVAEKIGPVDVVVSNAGVTAAAPVRDIKLEDFWKSFETNTKGNFNVAQAFTKVAAKNAVLIGVNSGIAHWQASAWGPVVGYASSKVAMAKLYEYFQSENPEYRVFSLQPGVIATEMASDVNTIDKDNFPDVELPGHFCVWLASGEADFLRGKFVYANWDVNELKQKAEEIVADPQLLTITLGGWGKGGAAV